MLHIHEGDIDDEPLGVAERDRIKHLIVPWTIGSDAVSVGRLRLDQGTRISPRRAQRNEIVLIVLAGNGTAIVDDEPADVTVGSVIRVPMAVAHQLVNDGEAPLEVIVVAAPALTRADIDAMGTGLLRTRLGS